MDDFINSFEKFSVNSNKEEFEDSLNDVISKLDKINNIDQEWVELKSNFSKLTYLFNLVDKYYIPESEKFLESLEKFLSVIDKTTVYYLQQIDWKEQIIIKKYFEDSLNTTDCIEKLKILLKGYSLLVPIVEDIRNERCIGAIDDPFFIREFNVKRRRI
jgi:hypothetical protein